MNQIARPLNSLLIKNALIVTMNQNREILRGNLLIDGDRIKSISQSEPEFEVDRVIDARGKVLIPGLIQAHVHLCQTLFRGQANDLELLDWLFTRILPLEGAHDPETLYCSAMLGIGELLQSGTTAIIDMESVHHTEAAFQAIVESGIRAVSGKCMIDHGEGLPESLMEKTDDSLQGSVDLLERWHGSGDGRLHYAFTPRFAVSCSEPLLVEVRNLAERYGVQIHTHASENRSEVALVRSDRGMDNVAYLNHLGLTGSNLVLAHCIWVTDDEIRLLAQSATNVVHCPSSNLKLASGIAPIPGMLEQGTHIALGADGAPCNNNLDPFLEMRLAALIHKPRYGPTSMPARSVLELATLGGAQAMGLDKEVGSLEVGKKADLAMINLEGIHCAPWDYTDIYGQLVYQAKASDVTLTVVDGRIVYEDGVLTTMDQDSVIRQANHNLDRIKKKLPHLF
ncbi:MAG: 5'-deoxyadenosine deaminase [Syntrophomonadales bacterium]|jgi:5-methylthioadenosine/S-adenosylhomocysteine deaminase